jgi:hypothetical protein
MNALRPIVREIVGLFVDDEFLALAVLGVVALAAAFAYRLQVPPAGVGLFLVAGCTGVLLASVARASRRRRR